MPLAESGSGAGTETDTDAESGSGAGEMGSAAAREEMVRLLKDYVPLGDAPAGEKRKFVQVLGSPHA